MTAEPASRHDPAGQTANQASIIDLTQRLIRVPTRGGLDDYLPAVDVVSEALITHVRQPVQILGTWNEPLGIAVTIPGADPRAHHYVLDAPLDTADIGDPDAWTFDPFSGEIHDGWLRGRGAADSKTAISIFTHLAGQLIQERPRGTLTLLFDLDEHTGGFGGIKAWVAAQDRKPDGVMIGYPGPDKIVTGGRGVWRARITVYGESAHSGASRNQGVSAILRATERLIPELHRQIVTSEYGDRYADVSQDRKLTVTSISGGAPGSFSVVPDACAVEVDVRLTRGFTAEDAQDLVHDAVEMSLSGQDLRPTIVEPVGDPWPAYRTPDDHTMVQALLHGARLAGLNPTPAVAGPSNIGCYLSQHGIPATAGFGVAYRGLHAADEAIDVATIPAVYAAYLGAVRRLLG